MTHKDRLEGIEKSTFKLKELKVIYVQLIYNTHFLFILSLIAFRWSISSVMLNLSWTSVLLVKDHAKQELST